MREAGGRCSIGEIQIPEIAQFSHLIGICKEGMGVVRGRKREREVVGPSCSNSNIYCSHLQSINYGPETVWRACLALFPLILITTLCGGYYLAFTEMRTKA